MVTAVIAATIPVTTVPIPATVVAPTVPVTTAVIIAAIAADTIAPAVAVATPGPVTAPIATLSIVAAAVASLGVALLAIAAVAAEPGAVAGLWGLGRRLGLGSLWRLHGLGRTRRAALAPVTLRTVAVRAVALRPVASFQALLPVAPIRPVAALAALRHRRRRLGQEHDGQGRHRNLHHHQSMLDRRRRPESPLDMIMRSVRVNRA